MTQEERYPHGECECRQGCSCQGIPGPAAEEITRNGKRLKVCTRCTLTGDTDREWLVTEASPLEPFRSWDALGLFCIVGHLQQSRRAAQPEGTDDV
jgi:hypothetical protein